MALLSQNNNRSVKVHYNMQYFSIFKIIKLKKILL